MTKWQQDFLKGYKDHEKFFDELCRKVYLILGPVTQAGIIELHSSGLAYIAANKPEVGEDFGSLGIPVTHNLMI